MRECFGHSARTHDDEGTIMAWSRILAATALAAGTLANPYAIAAPIAYTSNEGSGTVSVIDTATDKVVATLKLGEKPRGIALSPDGGRLYLSDQTANALVIVDTGKRTEIARVRL